MTTTTPAVTANPIYHYRASDELGEEAWDTLRSSVEVLYGTHGNWDDIKAVLKEWEEEFKVSTGNSLPGAYRSAKSVLKNAIINGLPFIGSAKTALEKLIKDKKAADKEDLSPQEKLDQLVQKAYNYAMQNNLPLSVITATGTTVCLTTEK